MSIRLFARNDHHQVARGQALEELGLTKKEFIEIHGLPKEPTKEEDISDYGWPEKKVVWHGHIGFSES